MENRTVIINGVSYTCLTDEEYEELKKGINKASEAVASIIKDGIDMAMNKYNK